MINLTKLGTVTKTWCKDGKHRMYVNDLCAVLGINPKKVKSGEEGKIARELMAGKLWYDVVEDAWGSQGIGPNRKEQLIAEILKQTGADEVEEEPEIFEDVKEEKVKEFTITEKTPNRMPETLEEVEIMMNAQGMPEFKSKVIFLQSVLRNKQIRSLRFEDVAKYQKLFMEYLTQEKEKQ